MYPFSKSQLRVLERFRSLEADGRSLLADLQQCVVMNHVGNAVSDAGSGGESSLKEDGAGERIHTDAQVLALEEHRIQIHGDRKSTNRISDSRCRGLVPVSQSTAVVVRGVAE